MTAAIAAHAFFKTRSRGSVGLYVHFSSAAHAVNIAWHAPCYVTDPHAKAVLCYGTCPIGQAQNEGRTMHALKPYPHAQGSVIGLKLPTTCTSSTHTHELPDNQQASFSCQSAEKAACPGTLPLTTRVHIMDCCATNLHHHCTLHPRNGQPLLLL
jgi:hypothetical protein